MQTIALILPHAVVYYSGLILALAILGGGALLLALRTAQGREIHSALLFLLLSLLLGLPLSRLVHWYCNSAQYASFASAMTDYSSGGYAPLGAALGMLLSALLLRLFGAVRDLPALLDCAAPAAALSMGIGRLASLFTSANRSKFTLEGEFFRRLPFMTSAVTPSGGVEWRIATFAWESISCFVLCLVLLALFRPLRSQKRFRTSWRDGNVFFLFLALYAAFTVMLDSTRYDALYLRSNGFVSLTQICCVAGLLFSTVVCSVRSVMANVLRPWHFVLWLLWAAGAGLAGYMEYYVQRHAAEFLFAYAVMEGALLLLFAIVCLLCRSTRSRAGGGGAERRGPPAGEAGSSCHDEGASPAEAVPSPEEEIPSGGEAEPPLEDSVPSLEDILSEYAEGS